VHAAARGSAARLEDREQFGLGVPSAQRRERLVNRAGVMREIVIYEDPTGRADQILTAAHALEARQRRSNLRDARAVALSCGTDCR
jgi:alkyl hydroperoxide reductase subunit AhpC